MKIIDRISKKILRKYRKYLKDHPDQKVLLVSQIGESLSLARTAKDYTTDMSKTTKKILQEFRNRFDEVFM